MYEVTLRHRIRVHKGHLRARAVNGAIQCPGRRKWPATPAAAAVDPRFIYDSGGWEVTKKDRPASRKGEEPGGRWGC